MSRIATRTDETTPAGARPLLDDVKHARHGVVPNLFRVLANSPAVLRSYLAFDRALRRGAIDQATRERIALAVAELNGCDYCLSAHTHVARTHTKLDDAEITANRSGASNDPTADAAVRLAAAIVRTRGHVADADLATFKAAGYDDAQALEVTALVALNTLANYVNTLARTDIDFPPITARAAA